MDDETRLQRLKEVFGVPEDMLKGEPSAAMKQLGEVFAADIWETMNKPGALASLFDVKEMPKEEQEKLWQQLESKLEQYND